MITRKAGDNLTQALAAAGFGTMGAIAADAVAHDDMDYMAQDLRELKAGFQTMSPEAQNAFLSITTDSNLSGLDRVLVGAALQGEIGPPKEIATAGDRAVTQAVALREQAPEVAAEVARLNQQEVDLLAQEIDAGTTPQAVLSAVQHEDAGVTPLPAVAGGTLAGIAGASALLRVPSAARRRS